VQRQVACLLLTTHAIHQVLCQPAPGVRRAEAMFSVVGKCFYDNVKTMKQAK
jgi:hypothetical protein